MTPTQARAFLAVATRGGFSEAARSLRVSQPTLSSQIQEIEKQYDVELFRRTGRGVSLTPTGQILLPHIRKMFSAFDDASAFLEEVKGRRRGQLRVGSYGPYDVMKLIGRYRDRFPNVNLTVQFHNSEHLAEKLLGDELDVAVLGRIRPQQKFFTLPLARPPLVLIAPRTDKWIGHGPVKPTDLSGEVIVRREPGSAVRASYDRFLDRARIRQGRAHEFGSREGVVNAVAENVGVGAIFDEGFLPDDRVVKLEIAGPPIRSIVDVVCLAARRSHPLIGGFLEIAKGSSIEHDRAVSRDENVVIQPRAHPRARSKTAGKLRRGSPPDSPQS